jgi:hypothetical protein
MVVAAVEQPCTRPIDAPLRPGIERRCVQESGFARREASGAALDGVLTIRKATLQRLNEASRRSREALLAALFGARQPIGARRVVAVQGVDRKLHEGLGLKEVEASVRGTVEATTVTLRTVGAGTLAENGDLG